MQHKSDSSEFLIAPLLDQVRNAALCTSRDGVITHVNADMARMLDLPTGISRVGTPITALAAPADRARLDALLIALARAPDGAAPIDLMLAHNIGLTRCQGRYFGQPSATLSRGQIYTV